MNKSSRKKIKLETGLKILLALIVLLACLKLFLGTDSPPENQVTDTKLQNLQERIDFAKCLMKKGWIMYGVDTCEYCLAQKKIFGQAFEQIHYINCDFQETICREKGLSYYPVWGNGTKLLTGIQTFQKLAAESGCPIPKLTQ